MTPNELRELHEFLDLYYKADNYHLTREMINGIKGIPLDSDKYEISIRYLRGKKFISPHTTGDRITMTGISALQSDQLKFEAAALEKIENEKNTLTKRFWIPVIISAASLCFNVYQYNKNSEKDLKLQIATKEKDSLSLVVDSLQQIHRIDSLQAKRKN